MVISAVCSGVAGMLGVAHFGSAQQDEFDDYLLDSISAVVVGGTSLFGGQGGIGNTIVGLFVLGVLNNGLDHVEIDSFLKILIRGLILLAGADRQRLCPAHARATSGHLMRASQITTGHRFFGRGSASAKAPNETHSSANTSAPFRSAVKHRSRRAYTNRRHQKPQ